MAALESVAISLFHFSYSPSPPLLSPARSRLPVPISTTKLAHKSHSPPLPISRKLQAFSSSSSPAAAVIQEKVSVEEKTQQETLQKRVFVLNLPWSFSVDDLKNLFSDSGTVEDAEIIKRKKDGKSRGYAFATMSSREEALAVIAKYDSHELMGRIIRVEFTKDNKKPSPPPPPRDTTRYKLVVLESPLGRSAGYGFVTFATKEEAESAISALNGKELFGRPITLACSERNADKTETGEDASVEQPTEL